MKTFADYGIAIPYGRDSGNVKVRCPNCATIGKQHTQDKCLSVNISMGVWNCHKCGWTGHLDNGMRDIQFVEPKKVYKRPERMGNPNLSDNAKDYMVNTRHIPLDVLEKMRVTEATASVIEGGEWVKRGCICFNYFLNGEHINTKYRSRNKGFAMITGCQIVPYNIDSALGKKKVIITEGEIDAMSFIATGYDNDSFGVVSVPNGANSAKCFDDFIESHFDDKEVIYIASDMDVPGIALREELLRRFGRENCRVVTYGEGIKDANELLIAKGYEAIIQAVNDAQEFPSDSVVGVSELSDNLDVLFKEGFHRANTIGIQAVDDLISFEEKRVLVLTGIPGSGKSKLLDEIAMRLCLRYEWRTAYFSPESEPYEKHIGEIISRLVGKKFQSGTMTYQEYQSAKTFINENFFWVKPRESYSLDNILKAAKWLVRRKGIKMLVIDPYNRLLLPSTVSDKNNAITVMTKLTNFAQDNNVMVALMVHPRKMGNDADGKIIMPSMYDASGAADFANMADFFIVVHRDKEKNRTIFKVEKVKCDWLGSTGRCELTFNINNRRFLDSELWDNSNWLIENQKIKEQEQVLFPESPKNDLSGFVAEEADPFSSEIDYTSLPF